MASKEVVIPKCVADWIVKCKSFKVTISLSFALSPAIWEENRLSGECIKWLIDAHNQELFARAWLDGYMIKEAKKYLVTIKGVSPNSCVLKYYYDTERWIMGTNVHYNDARLYHTKEELIEAGFEEVFDSPLFEVKEMK